MRCAFCAHQKEGEGLIEQLVDMAISWFASLNPFKTLSARR